MLPLRLLRLQRHHAIEGERELDGHGLLRSQGAVVVEGSNALGNGHEIGPTFFRDPCHELEDGLLRHALVPGRERVGGRGAGGRRERADEHSGKHGTSGE